VPELNDTADITERISQRESYSAPWTSNYWATKYTDRYPSQALSSDCCEYSTLEAKAGHWKKQTGPNWKLSTMNVSVRADDVGCSRETDHEWTR
jgi:hypothetical protein